MTLLSQIATDATNILDDETQGYSEPVVFKQVGNNGAGIFLDSWEEVDDPRHPDLVIAKTTFILFDIDHGDLLQRVATGEVFEIHGVKPDPAGMVTLNLRRINASLPA